MTKKKREIINQVGSHEIFVIFLSKGGLTNENSCLHDVTRKL